LIVAAAGGFILGRWSRPQQPQPLSPIDTVDRGAVVQSDAITPESLTTRLHDLESSFSAFGSNAAHPSAMSAHAQFQEATRRLASPDVPVELVLQYVEGANWGLSCAALAALKERADGSQGVERVQLHCEKLSAWAMYFALDFL